MILIGGTSHVGKSTVARALATRLGWDYESTDRLARHPGRPWRDRPPERQAIVANHYLSMRPEALLADVVRHYRNNVWPIVQSLVRDHTEDTSAAALVLEGSAVLPELAGELVSDDVAALWLTGAEGLLRARIYEDSAYPTRSPREQRMIDRFLARSWVYQRRMVATIRALDLANVCVRAIDVTRAAGIAQLVDRCLAALCTQPAPGPCRPHPGGL